MSDFTPIALIYGNPSWTVDDLRDTQHENTVRLLAVDGTMFLGVQTGDMIESAGSVKMFWDTYHLPMVRFLLSEDDWGYLWGRWQDFTRQENAPNRAWLLTLREYNLQLVEKLPGIEEALA